MSKEKEDIEQKENATIEEVKEDTKKAGMYNWEKVDILNVNNGERFSTYIIPGKKGEICLNGAAARKACPGDKIIIVTYTKIEESGAENWNPKIVLLNDDNSVKAVKN